MQSFDTRPLQVRAIGPTVLNSIDEAVDFLRALPFAEHTEPLIDVMEAADAPNLERRARLAFETFAFALQLPVRLEV